MKKIIKDNSPFFIFAVGIFLFNLIFTRYFLKMDDGNFLGIATAPDFSYGEFLSYRYNNISGRTVNEFLVMFFCRHNIILWKLFISALLIFIASFFVRLSSYFSGEFSKKQRQVFCVLSFFMMMVSCLNPSVFWFAGSFTYLFPFWGLCATAFPFLVYIYEKRLSAPLMIIGIFGSVAAASQEQGAVCVVALIIILSVAIKLNSLKFKIVFLVPLAVSIHFLVYLFTSPGMAKRGETEAANFERYLSFSFGEKLLCGMSAFFANSFYLSAVLILSLVMLLSASVYSYNKNKALLFSVNVLSGFTCIVLNIICCATGKGLAHVQVRESFLSGDFSWQVKAFIAFGFLLLIAVMFMSVLLLIKNKSVGFPVFLCLGAGFGCALMMSFSSSIFASGQRVYFFTNMFIALGCIILLSSAQKSKLTKAAFKIAVGYAVATAVLNIFAFTFFEHPLMG